VALAKTLQTCLDLFLRELVRSDTPPKRCPKQLHNSVVIEGCPMASSLEGPRSAFSCVRSYTILQSDDLHGS